MFLHTILAGCLLASSHAASVSSRSNSELLQHSPPSAPPCVIGPVAELPIVNRVIAPDGFERSATLAGGIFPGPLIKAQKHDNFSINVVNQLQDKSMALSTSVHCMAFSKRIRIGQMVPRLLVNVRSLQIALSSTNLAHPIKRELIGITRISPPSIVMVLEDHLSYMTLMIHTKTCMT
jgi:hypothetical protein